MSHSHAQPRRLTSILALILVALMSGFVAWTLPRTNADAAVTSMAHGHDTSPRTSAQRTLHDQMRKLWEDHVTWTRLAIVTFADGSPSFPATADRLLRNQVDIGNAIKPYFGDAAGTRLTALLHDHITIAVDVLKAAKSGDDVAFTEANTRWYANANDIADFLAKASPKYWPQAHMRADMRTHLDQTLAEAAHELGGDYQASVADYDAVHAHILEMADMLSEGIVAKFPSRFR